MHSPDIAVHTFDFKGAGVYTWPLMEIDFIVFSDRGD